MRAAPSVAPPSSRSLPDFGFGAGITVFDCGPDAVLYCAASGDLCILNHTAATVWRRLRRGVPFSEVCRDLAAASQVDPANVERDVRRLVGAWRELASRRVDPAPVVDAPPTPARARGDTPASDAAYRGRYRLADFVFELRAGKPADQRAAESVLGHLRDSSGRDPDAVLELVRRRGRWLLTHDGEVIDACDAAPAVGPMVHAGTLMLAYGHDGGFAALHAGAVLRDGQCILLPAVSGGGKSTLTAALAAAGYGYGSDDFVILTGPPVRVRAVPVSIGLKEGSWALLERSNPAIAELPIHVRADGKRIRYLPTACAVNGTDPSPVRALIFSEYRSGSATTCRPIRPAEALLRLTRAGYDTRLSEETVRTFVTWLCDVPSHELLYSDLDDAVATIDALLR